MKNPLVISLILCVLGLNAQEDKDYGSLDQGLTLPPHGDNQKSFVKQHIGNLAWVSVTYNSPDVTSPSGKSRDGKIWGQLIPYGLTDLGFGPGNPAPWRVGANENTIIVLSHDMEIEGKPIKAGTYGLHLIVNETRSWTWIFNKVTRSWGSYNYDESKDALRVDVVPEDAPYQEWLNFEFTERRTESVELSMFWERKRIPMKLTIPNMNELYVNRFREELTGIAGFNHQNWLAAARFCAQRNYNLEEALVWADKAINLPYTGIKSFGTLQAKGLVLMKLGRAKEAEEYFISAVADQNSRSFPIHQYASEMIDAGMKIEALHVFEANYKKFKNTSLTSLGMAKGLSAIGKYKEAAKYAELALEKEQNAEQKTQIEGWIQRLKNGEDIN